MFVLTKVDLAEKSGFKQERVGIDYYCYLFPCDFIYIVFLILICMYMHMHVNTCTCICACMYIVQLHLHVKLADTFYFGWASISNESTGLLRCSDRKRYCSGFYSGQCSLSTPCALLGLQVYQQSQLKRFSSMKGNILLNRSYFSTLICIQVHTV